MKNLTIPILATPFLVLAAFGPPAAAGDKIMPVFDAGFAGFQPRAVVPSEQGIPAPVVAARTDAWLATHFPPGLELFPVEAITSCPACHDMGAPKGGPPSLLGTLPTSESPIYSSNMR